MTDKLVLAFWDFRGIAQPIRTLLEYVKLPYETKIYTDQDQWYKVDKVRLLEENPYANLPYLKDGGHYVYETEAILLYIIKKSGRLDLIGKSGEEQVLIAQAKGLFKDFQKAYVLNLVMLPKDQYQEFKMEKWQAVQAILFKIDNFVSARKFTAGKDLTYVDFIMLELLDTVSTYDPSSFTYPNLKELHQTLKTTPNIYEYIGSGKYPTGKFYPTDNAAYQ